MELLTAVLPSINIHQIKTWIRKCISGYNSNTKKEETFQIVRQSGSRHLNLQDIPKEKLLNCKICKQSPIILPSSGGCGHYFCYYCLAGNIEAVGGDNFPCPVCGIHLNKENLITLSSVTKS